jgi:hypothetical protein
MHDSCLLLLPWRACALHALTGRIRRRGKPRHAVSSTVLISINTKSELWMSLQQLP